MVIRPPPCMGVSVSTPILMHCDNKSVIVNDSNLVFHDHTNILRSIIILLARNSRKAISLFPMFHQELS